MKEQMLSLINLLKLEIKQNLFTIKRIEEEIKETLRQPVSEERSMALNDLFNKNNKLLKENHDSLNIQLRLLKYINMYYSNHSSLDKTDLEKIQQESDYQFENKDFTSNIQYFDDNEIYQSLLNQTILGDITFDSNHQMFNNQQFVEDLYDGYIYLENYEMCSFIQKMKGEYMPR